MYESESPASRKPETGLSIADSYLRAVPHPVYVCDEDHRYLYCNDAYCQLVGARSPETLIGQKALRSVRRDTHVLAKNRPDISREESWRTAKGSVEVFATRFTMNLDDGRRVVAGMIRRKEAAMQEATLMHRVISHTQCLLWEALVYELPAGPDTPDEMLLDRERRTMLNWNLKVIAHEAVRRWLPFPEGDAQDLATQFYLARPEEERNRANETALNAFREGKERYSQEFSIILDDRLHWLHEDVSMTKVKDGLWHLVGICTDISERKRVETNLAFQALHDPLTGLSNRRQFLETMAQLPLKTADRPGLLFIDIDNFKNINDSQGHRFGDAVLVEAARRIRATMRGAGLISRLGGDEFTVLVAHAPDPQLLVDLAERLNEAMRAPVLVQGITLHLSLSVGIAYSIDGDVGHLLRNSDTAMHRAKGRGKSGWAFFEKAMDSEIQERFERESALRQALHDGDISLHFQPIYSLKTGAIVALEGLARWREGDAAFKSPGQFIALAEEIGLIVPLGAHLLREACRRGKEWQARFPQLHLNLNISPRQFHESSFVDRVRTQLTESGLAPERLSLELTESILLEESEACIERLERLADLGIRLVLDDFGTGYTSLAHLVRLPIQALKIDRRFVLGMADPNPAVAAHCESVVKSTVALAATRNLEVTAVGIEDAQAQTRLVALGADYGQGYHVGRPMPEADVLSFLSASQVNPLRLAA